MKHLRIILALLAPVISHAQQRTDTPNYLLPPVQQQMPIRDSVMVIRKLPLQGEWEAQTAYGASAVTETATAGFFSTGKGGGIYAFHNTAPRGSILRVRNINNERIVYVKVLGPMPLTKQLKGCTLALSNAAKVALDVRDFKAYCEISYLGY